MKTLFSMSLMTGLLISSLALAQVSATESAVGQCFKQALPQELIPTHGNKQYGASFTPFVQYLSGSEYAADSDVVFSPYAIVVADEVGVKSGMQFEQRTNLESDTTLDKANQDMGTELAYADHYYVAGDDSATRDTNMDLIIDSGLPYLAAHRHVDSQCSTDQYDVETCTVTAITYSNLMLVTPKSFQPVLTFINANNKQASTYSFQAEQYRNCLSAVH
jgi:hypothetical protein